MVQLITDEEMKREFAEKMYLGLYGHLDDKKHRDEMTTEMWIWLCEGDLFDDTSVADACAEWREWVGDDPDLQ